jgi:hypothetical protein
LVNNIIGAIEFSRTELIYLLRIVRLVSNKQTNIIIDEADAQIIRKLLVKLAVLNGGVPLDEFIHVLVQTEDSENFGEA